MCVACVSVLCSATAVNTIMQAIESEGMLNNAKQRGTQLMQGLVQLADKWVPKHPSSHQIVLVMLAEPVALDPT